MKALSLTQPWAQACFLNLKHFETRSWSTNYRGPLLIHAAKGFPKYAREFAESERALGRGMPSLPFGAIIGQVELINVWKTENLIFFPNGSLEIIYGDFSPGRFAWEFQNPVTFPKPIPYRGQQRLFEVEV